MKTRNFILFVLTAVVCGAFLCADSQAKVCFLGEDCGSGGNFGDTTPVEDMLKDACSDAGYDKTSCTATEYSYVCPYKSKYKKCCPMKYRFEACIYPTEVDVSLGDAYGDGKGKCGTRYSCRCPSDYKITSSFAETNNCQPGGGYCLLNDGSSDVIKYKTCTCDRDIFTDVTSCKNNQSESSSCKDDGNNVYKKCYCDRSVYPNTYCSFGGKGGSCVDSNSGREYYKECKTAEEACEDEGYYNNCTSRTTNGTTSSATCNNNSYGYYACEDGAQCPYHTDYFKCVFSVKGYCNANGYTEESSSKQTGASCQDKYGVQGTRQYCSKGPGSNGKYYYYCEVTCDDQIKAAVSRGELSTNSKVYGAAGIYAVQRSDYKGNHLYLREDVGFPKKNIDRSMTWANASMAGTSYVSINGYAALYDVDSTKYSACKSKRSEYYAPTLYLSHSWISEENSFLDVDLSDINIHFVMNSGSGDGKEYYKITANRTWKNVTFSENNVDTSIIKPLGLTNDTGKMRTSSSYDGWDDVPYDGNRSNIAIRNSSTLTITGYAYFYMGSHYFSDKKDVVKNYGGYASYTNIRPDSDSAQIVFDKATIYAYTGMDWDGASHSTMLFKDSTGNVGKVWSQWNIGLLNSDIKFTTIHIDGWNNSKANASFGGNYSSTYTKQTPGIFLKNSRMEIGRSSYNTFAYAIVMRHDDGYAKLYIDKNSKVVLNGPFVANKNVSICIPDTGGTAYTKTGHSEGGYRFETASGSAILPYSYSSVYTYHYIYGVDGTWCLRYNVGRCTNDKERKRTRILGNSSGGGNWKGTDSVSKPGWSNGFLMPSCYSMQYSGMGYVSY